MLELNKKQIKKAGYYVYKLIDPIGKKELYVGVGYGNKIYHHIEGKLQMSDFDDFDLLFDPQLEIFNSMILNKEPILPIILRYGMTKEIANEILAFYYVTWCCKDIVIRDKYNLLKKQSWGDIFDRKLNEDNND
jgi:hypothetical protein